MHNIIKDTHSDYVKLVIVFNIYIQIYGNYLIMHGTKQE